MNKNMKPKLAMTQAMLHAMRRRSQQSTLSKDSKRHGQKKMENDESLKKAINTQTSAQQGHCSKGKRPKKCPKVGNKSKKANKHVKK